MGDIEINRHNNISNPSGENDNSHTKSSRHNVSSLLKSRKSSNNSTPPVPPKSIHEHTRRGCKYKWSIMCIWYVHMICFDLQSVHILCHSSFFYVCISYVTLNCNVIYHLLCFDLITALQLHTHRCNCCDDGIMYGFLCRIHEWCLLIWICG